MRQQTENKASDTEVINLYTLDVGSPLLSASLFEADEGMQYSTTSQDRFQFAEERERGRWGKQRNETDEERADRQEAQRRKTQETHQKVEAGLDSLCTSLADGKSEQFLALLDTVSRFHRYSFGNAMLIAFQNPEATIVAGFTTWKELGRYVKSGEKGIAILAPVPKRVKVETQEESTTGEDITKTKTLTGSGVWGFRVVYVFDVSQTDGKPLPEFATVRGDPAHYLALLKEQVKAAGIVLEYKEDLGGSLGQSGGGRILLKTGLSPAQEFSTLVHEFAHEQLHPLTERREIPKRIKETEAEAVAYVVSRAIGLEPGTASSDYIQLYQGNADTLAASLDRIQKTAAHILSELEGPGIGFQSETMA